jgi:hypothetical protein
LEEIDFAGEGVGAVVEAEGGSAEYNDDVNGDVKGARLKAAATNSKAG